jgi:hypothetical protein
MLALLNTLVMLDTAHEGYCHGPPPRDGTLPNLNLISDCAVSLTQLQTLAYAACLAWAVLITTRAATVRFVIHSISFLALAAW